MSRRKCRNGHEQIPENIRIVNSKGKVIQRCKICDKLAKKIHQERKIPKPCSVDGCNGLSYYKGLCESHRKKSNKNEELAVLFKDKSLTERILEKLEIDNNGCWVWTGVLQKRGYGSITFKNKRYLVHRAVYSELYKIELTPSQVLDHLCMNKSCCNPDHLQMVTQRENVKRFQAYRLLEEKYDKLVEFLKILGYEVDEDGCITK